MNVNATETLAVDFGTSNTAAGAIVDGSVRLVELEAGHDTIPTALFLDFDARRTVYGQTAVDALIGGEYGRFLRALKSVLGTPLMREKRQFMNERKTLLDITADFLATVKQRAEDSCGRQFTSVLSGRPVHFRGSGENVNQRALADLDECYRRAGFRNVSFMAEPEAAARAAIGSQGFQGVGMVVDIGGGTSDFSVFRTSGAGMDIVASHGIGIGGTDFDRVLSLAHVMPEFGLGSEIRKEFGQGTDTMGRAIYVDLATWEKIPFVYSPQTLREVRKLERLSVRPECLKRLGDILESELGHDVSFAVEAAKIAANDPVVGAGYADLSEVEKGLSVRLDAGALGTDLAEYGRSLATCFQETVDMAGIALKDVDVVVFVGGSSLIEAVRDPISKLVPQARLEMGEAFTAIVSGLTTSLCDT